MSPGINGRELLICHRSDLFNKRYLNFETKLNHFRRKVNCLRETVGVDCKLFESSFGSLHSGLSQIYGS